MILIAARNDAHRRLLNQLLDEQLFRVCVYPEAPAGHYEQALVAQIITHSADFAARHAEWIATQIAPLCVKPPASL